MATPRESRLGTTQGTGKPCSICYVKNVKRNVDAMLDDGASLVDIGARYSISDSTLRRHKRHWQEQHAVMQALHKTVPPSQTQPAERTDRPRRLTKEQILQKATGIIYDAEDLFKAAKDAGIIKDAVRALESVRRAVELCGKFEGLGDRVPSVVIDQRQVTMLNTVNELSIEQMRAIAYGQPLALPNGDYMPENRAITAEAILQPVVDDAIEATYEDDEVSDDDELSDEPRYTAPAPTPREMRSAELKLPRNNPLYVRDRRYGLLVTVAKQRTPDVSTERWFKTAGDFKYWQRQKGDSIIISSVRDLATNPVANG